MVGLVKFDTETIPHPFNAWWVKFDTIESWTKIS